MKITASPTVGEVARNVPAAARFFEKIGIDYCCGGNKTLETACREAGVDFNTVLATLETIQELEPASEKNRNWNTAPLTELIAHIVEKHHSVVRSQVPRLTELITKMSAAHGETRPEFPRVKELIRTLHSELEMHLRKEEQILFPYVEELERSIGHTSLPSSCFGTVRNPIGAMEQEHIAAGDLLSRVRSLLTDRTGCPTCQEFYRTFDAFEQDLHQHIHLENNILFPRTVELEASSTG